MGEGLRERVKERYAGADAMSPRIEPAVREDLPVVLFLLTETADGFFPRFGFSAAERSDVRGSVEFVSACPESARAMAAELA